jgi:hypothetical protein
MLACYYDIFYKDRFEELFGKYYIDKNPTPLANSYRVLLFNFSGINTPSVEKAYQAFWQKVQSGLLQFFQRNAIFSQKAVDDILSQINARTNFRTVFRFGTR